jgi:hypothetical protein
VFLAILSAVVILWALGTVVVVAMCRVAALGDDEAAVRRAADRADRITYGAPTWL